MNKFIVSISLVAFFILVSFSYTSGEPAQTDQQISSSSQDSPPISPKVLAFRKIVEKEIRKCYRKCVKNSPDCKEEVILRSRKDLVWHAAPHEANKSLTEWKCSVLWRPTGMYNPNKQ
ncbi:MAG: hypothetical protein ACE5EK_05540 [Nitrospinales bacterium]